MNFIKSKPGLVLTLSAALSYLSFTSDSLISTLTKWNNSDSDYTLSIKKQLLELASFEKHKMNYKEFELLADKDLSKALSYFPYYTDKADEEKIVEIILSRDLTSFLINSNKYKDKDYIARIINSIPYEEFLFVSEHHIPKDKLFEPIRSLLQGLKSIKEVKLGNTIISLDTSQYNNIYSGLLKTYLADKEDYLNSDMSIDREKVKTQYEENIKKFIEQGQEWVEEKENTHTFWVRVSHDAGDDRSDAFGYRSEELKKIYKENFTGAGKFHDYSSNTNPQSADYILNAFEKNIKQYPRDKHILHLGAHGEYNGSALLTGGTRTKNHFHRLLNIQSENPSHIKVDLGSCLSGKKASDFYNNRTKNLSMDSGQYRSYGKEGGSDDAFLEAFETKDEHGNFVADYDRNGIVSLNEALLYRNTQSNKSLMPMMFDDGTGGRARDISMNDDVYRDASLYSS